MSIPAPSLAASFATDPEARKRASSLWNGGDYSGLSTARRSGDEKAFYELAISSITHPALLGWMKDAVRSPGAALPAPERLKRAPNGELLKALGWCASPSGAPEALSRALIPELLDAIDWAKFSDPPQQGDLMGSMAKKGLWECAQRFARCLAPPPGASAWRAGPGQHPLRLNLDDLILGKHWEALAWIASNAWELIPIRQQEAAVGEWMKRHQRGLGAFERELQAPGARAAWDAMVGASPAGWKVGLEFALSSGCFALAKDLGARMPAREALGVGIDELARMIEVDDARSLEGPQMLGARAFITERLGMLGAGEGLDALREEFKNPPPLALYETRSPRPQWLLRELLSACAQRERAELSEGLGAAVQAAPAKAGPRL